MEAIISVVPLKYQMGDLWTCPVCNQEARWAYPVHIYRLPGDLDDHVGMIEVCKGCADRFDD